MTSHDQTFRVVLVVASLILLPIAAFYRIRSEATREKLDRRREGLFILLTLRPVGLAGMLGFIAHLVDPAWMAWASVPLPVWLRWAGVGVGLLAGGLWIWTFHTLGRNLTDTVVTRKAHTLVTSGPYRWVRHPFYDAVGLCILANSLATANWFILVAGVLVLSLLVSRTRREEAELLARFGDSYRDYMERTGRFLPKT